MKSNFIITSFVFENRNVNLDLDKEEQDRINYHSGWDFSVPIGTEFYSICNGTISNVVNTQFNDLPYNQSNNSVGNFIEIICDNNFNNTILSYTANSVPFLIYKNRYHCESRRHDWKNIYNGTFDRTTFTFRIKKRRWNSARCFTIY